MVRPIIENAIQIPYPPTPLESETLKYKDEKESYKTSKVNINLFNSHMASFASKIIFYAGMGAAIVNLAPSVVVIPTLFAAKFLAVATLTVPIIPIVTGIGAALFILELARHKKEFLYEFSLLYTLSGGKDWWNAINSDIVLGAIPLGPEHADRIVTEENIGAVLTLLEEFEVEKGIVDPVSGQEWINKGVVHCHIKAVDFTGVPVDQIQQGVQFVEDQIEEGKKVYIHCKAGRGRSATIVVSYFLKKQYGGTDTDFETAFKDIHDMVKAKRPQINLNANQRQTIREYYELFCYVKPTPGKDAAAAAG